MLFRKRSELLNVTNTKHRYVSAYTNAGYTYDSKYSLNASIRVDQADTFWYGPEISLSSFMVRGCKLVDD